jgi:hypothetical protein
MNDCVAYLLAQLPADATLGVVTPYKAQAEGFGRRWRNEPRVRAGTVPTFLIQQGDTPVAILLDRTAIGGDPARHLRLQYQRTELLRDPSTSRRQMRLPIWKLYDDPPATSP